MRKTWRLQGSSETCIIAPRSLVSQEEQGAYLSAQIDKWLADPLTQKAVLDIYESIRGQSALLARRLRGHELQRYVKSEILEAFRRGELVLLRMPHVSILPPLTMPKQREEPEAEEPPPTEEPTRKEEKNWVELELLDENGQPVSNARYLLCLPDGSERTGTLGNDGRAREEGIDPGICRVTFPDYDAAEWEAA
jgi:hypothetical protein